MLKNVLTRLKKHDNIKANQGRLNKRLPSAESLLSFGKSGKENNPNSKTENGNPVPSHQVTDLAEEGVIPLYNTEVTQLVSCFASDSVLR